jgi:protein TonB
MASAITKVDDPISDQFHSPQSASTSLGTSYDAIGLRALIARIREHPVEKVFAASLALVLEALLLLALIAVGAQSERHEAKRIVTVTFDAKELAKPTQEERTKPRENTAAPVPYKAQAQSQPSSQVAVAAPLQPPAAIIPISPQQAQSFDLARVPKRPNAPDAPVYGPAFAPTFGDSERVGNAPNGEPMYAARWYPHEPTHEQMAGYLSTADPGWALITCKTVADYRVEDCVGLDEYPEGAHLIRAALAAAWQYRVQAPRVGGVAQVGDWVRIRIEYDLRPAKRYGDADDR